MAASKGMAKAKGKSSSGKPNQKKSVPGTKDYGKGRNSVRGGGAVPMR